MQRKKNRVWVFLGSCETVKNVENIVRTGLKKFPYSFGFEISRETGTITIDNVTYNVEEVAHTSPPCRRTRPSHRKAGCCPNGCKLLHKAIIPPNASDTATPLKDTDSHAPELVTSFHSVGEQEEKTSSRHDQALKELESAYNTLNWLDHTPHLAIEAKLITRIELNKSFTNLLLYFYDNNEIADIKLMNACLDNRIAMSSLNKTSADEDESLVTDATSTETACKQTQHSPTFFNARPGQAASTSRINKRKYLESNARGSEASEDNAYASVSFFTPIEQRTFHHDRPQPKFTDEPPSNPWQSRY